MYYILAFANKNRSNFKNGFLLANKQRLPSHYNH
jgi:hypothetical protein